MKQTIFSASLLVWQITLRSANPLLEPGHLQQLALSTPSGWHNHEGQKICPNARKGQEMVTRDQAFAQWCPQEQELVSTTS